MNSVQVYLYTSILQWSANSPQSPLPISCYTLCSQPSLLFTLLCYPSTLHYSPHPFRTLYSYTQSPTSPSALFYMLAMPLLWMLCKCWYLCMAIKIEKKRAIAHCLFFMPENPYGESCNPTHGQFLTSQLVWAYYNRQFAYYGSNNYWTIRINKEDLTSLSKL